ncbi:MAG: hypothetical protein WA441_04310 [Methyloceanibacter sp.]|jgi:hypothetical protein
MMNATSNPQGADEQARKPQAAAEQARKNYRDMTTPDTVPEAVRAVAEKTVAQTREVYDLDRCVERILGRAA